MSNVKPITAEEYKAAVEAAKWMADNMSSLNVVYKRMARVLLALAGAWKEVKADGWCEHDAIAARHGLPVDEPKPCPTCGGYEVVANGEYFTKPCPTCQGGR